MTPLPNLDDLIWLFEGHPEPRYRDETLPSGHVVNWRTDWPYTTVTFRTVRTYGELTMTLSPSYGKVRLRATRDDVESLDLALRGVASVEVERIHDRELLRLAFTESEVLGTLWVQLKPDLSVSWSVGRD